VGTDAAAADCMAAGAIGGQQRLAASCRRAGLFCENRAHQANGEQAYEEPVEDCAVHDGSRYPSLLPIAARIVSSSPFPSRGFSMIGTPALSACLRSDRLAWLVTRIAGAEKFRSRNWAIRLQSAGFGDLFIHNQAVATGQLARSQQLGSGRVATDGQAFNLEPKLERVSNRKITADDDDDEPSTRQFVLMCHALACAGGFRIARVVW
jgi:hypothetical protein